VQFLDEKQPQNPLIDFGQLMTSIQQWCVPAAGLARILLQEPPGLCIGKVRLADGEVVLGVLGEPIACENKQEITQWGGWRAYIESLEIKQSSPLAQT
jgi:hypothetical protein